MSSSVELSLAYKFANAPVLGFPFPHMFIENVFPEDFYERLQANIPDPSVMVPIEQARSVKGYKERFVLDIGKPHHQEILPPGQREFWRDFSQWLCSGRFANLAIQKFQPLIQQRFNNALPNFYNEALLVEDVTKYSLGPHTDAPRKVITMLFYLPKDRSQAHLGTSMYVPKDAKFVCQGGPHYGFEGFTRVHTMPFLPNSLFVFFKSERSFHGVEPVTDPDTRRWLLLFDVYAQLPQTKPASPAPGSGARIGGSNLKL